MDTRRIRAVVLGIATAGLLVGSALAGPTTLKVWDTNAWDQKDEFGWNSGGPFEVEPIGFGAGVQGLGQHEAASGRYMTYCVERNEYLSPGTTYDVVMNDKANNGGYGGGSPDPLDARTAFLFEAFIKGTLDDKLNAAGLGVFTYGSSSAGGVSGNALQEVIWVIENEIGSVAAGLTADLMTLATAAVDDGGSGEWCNKWGVDGIGHVRVLNMELDGVKMQDLLILIPLPLPVGMALIGLLGVGIVSYRMRAAA